MQTKPNVSAMKRETIKGGKVIKQVAVKTPSGKIMVKSEMGKPQSMADRKMREEGMIKSLNSIAKDRVKAGGMSNLNQGPVGNLKPVQKLTKVMNKVPTGGPKRVSTLTKVMKTVKYDKKK